MASSESDLVRSRRFGRSSSGSRHVTTRSSSNSPFKHNGSGLLSVLRQKFSSRVSRSRESADGNVLSCQQASSDVPSSSATLSSSWRSRPRHIDKPIRPAYSDESLSCCGRRSTCLRGRVNQHQSQTGHELSVFDPERPTASSKKAAAAGIIICKYCHSKNDQSPSDIEISEQEISQSEDGKVYSIILDIIIVYSHIL